MTYHLTHDCTDIRKPAGVVAPLSLFNSMKQNLKELIARYRRHRKVVEDRNAFKQMLHLDDELLDDIGVTRSNVEWASRLPLHTSAARALEATKKRARPKIRP